MLLNTFWHQQNMVKIMAALLGLQVYSMVFVSFALDFFNEASVLKNEQNGETGGKRAELWNYKIKGNQIKPHVIKVLAFGDSLTEGYLSNGRKFHPYTTYLEELLNTYTPLKRFDVINEGVSGECVYVEMATRLPELLKKYNPRLVIILGGTNDLHKLDAKNEVNLFYELKSLHEMAHKAGALTVAVTIPEANVSDSMLSAYPVDTYKEIRQDVNAKLVEYATHNPNVVLCDLSKELSIRGDPSLWDDNIHPSTEGYRKMAKILFEAIKDLEYD